MMIPPGVFTWQLVLSFEGARVDSGGVAVGTDHGDCAAVLGDRYAVAHSVGER